VLKKMPSRMYAHLRIIENSIRVQTRERLSLFETKASASYWLKQVSFTLVHSEKIHNFGAPFRSWKKG